MDWIFFLIIALAFIIIFAVGSLRRAKHRKVAREIFKGERGEPVTMINSSSQASTFIAYLKDLLNDIDNNQNLIIECAANDKNTYVRFEHDRKAISAAISPEKSSAVPQSIGYDSFHKVKLHHRTYSVSTGSGKNRRTTYYNHYYTYLEGATKLELYNHRVTVSSDKGVEESRSRMIGELLAHLLEVDLERINGEVVVHTDLDKTILDKLGKYEKKAVPLKKEYFTVTDDSNGYCIHQLLYYKTGMLVFGIILSVLVGIGGSIYMAMFFSKLYIFLSILVAVLLLVLVINNSKRSIPKLKPLIFVNPDSLLIRPKLKHGMVEGGRTVDFNQIEEIDVRQEQSRGYSVRLVGDEVIVNAVSFINESKSLWIKEELLDCIQKIKNGGYYY